MKRNRILNELNTIKSILNEKKNKPLTISEAAQYLHLSQSYLYKLTSKKRIPCHKPNGKYLYFFKTELKKWITEERKNSRKVTVNNDKSNI